MHYLLCEAAAAAILCRAAWAFCRAVEWSASCCSASARVCSRFRMEAVLLRDPPANHTSCKLLWAAPSTSILFIAKLCPGILQFAAVTAAAENKLSWRRHWCACAHGVCGVACTFYRFRRVVQEMSQEGSHAVPVSRPPGLKSSPSKVMQRVRTSLWNARALAVLESCNMHCATCHASRLDQAITP